MLVGEDEVRTGLHEAPAFTITIITIIKIIIKVDEGGEVIAEGIDFGHQHRGLRTQLATKAAGNFAKPSARGGLALSLFLEV